MDRREFLRLGLAAALGVRGLAEASSAAAAPRKSEGRLRAIEKGARGTTFDLAPRTSPFPIPGGAFSDPTVLAFVPDHLRVGAGRELDVVVFFHGHGTTAREAMTRQRLREQLSESRQNAILVVPQGPVRAGVGDFGRLMARGGLARLLDEVRSLLGSPSATAALGAASCARASRVAKVVVAAHSGGYRAAAAAVARSGSDVREAWLFDALYGEAEAFRDWLLAAPEERKLVSFAIAGEPLRESLALAAELRTRGVEVLLESPVARLSRAEMVRARAIVARPAALHGTVAAEESSLRDCLLASCFRGRGSESFFEDADRPRTIARRG